MRHAGPAPRRRAVSTVVVVAVVALAAGAGFVVKAVARDVVASFDVDVAFDDVAHGKDVEAALGPFVDHVAPAAVRVAVARANAGDVAGAEALVDRALKIDPGSAPAWRLKVQLVGARGGDVDAVAGAAARWGAALQPLE